MLPLPKTLRSHRRLARLGVVVGALLCALPVIQVLRDQGAAVDAAKLRRAEVDLMARAVDVQRGLMIHGALAGQLLRSRSKQERARLAMQAEVDERLALLTSALAADAWPRALREAQALTEDWWSLAQRIAARRISGADSDLKHRLLIEQTLQVMDLSSAQRPQGTPGDLSAALAQAKASMLGQATLTEEAAGAATQGEARMAALQAHATALAATWLLHRQDSHAALAAAERQLMPPVALLLLLLATALAAIFGPANRRSGRAATPSGAPAHQAPGIEHAARPATRPLLDAVRLLQGLRRRAAPDAGADSPATRRMTAEGDGDRAATVAQDLREH